MVKMYPNSRYWVALIPRLPLDRCKARQRATAEKSVPWFAVDGVERVWLGIQNPSMGELFEKYFTNPKLPHQNIFCFGLCILRFPFKKSRSLNSNQAAVFLTLSGHCRGELRHWQTCKWHSLHSARSFGTQNCRWVDAEIRQIWVVSWILAGLPFAFKGRCISTQPFGWPNTARSESAPQKHGIPQACKTDFSRLAGFCCCGMLHFSDQIECRLGRDPQGSL